MRRNLAQHTQAFASGGDKVMKKIDAVEMVRNIRDKQNADTSGKSPEEIISARRPQKLPPKPRDIN
ncbi:hypothetical protein MJD09_07655 [bacterium]|nr:hypothetical protein [bacterium]